MTMKTGEEEVDVAKPVVEQVVVESGPVKEVLPANKTLILHQYPRIPLGPTSSFALKLETYLRICKFAYENDFSRAQSSKGKTPWMTFEGKEVADSSMCIEYLKQQTGLDLNAGLSTSEKAISRAFQKLIEEELYWVLQSWRWLFDKEETIAKAMNSGKGLKGFFAIKFIRNKIRKDTHAHGIGRHSVPEIMKIGQDDLTAVAEFLGEKKYFMGDVVSDIDCTLFGLLAQLVYVTNNCPLTSFIRENHGNLMEYCDRVRGEVWPDWEEVCLSCKLEKESKKKERSKTAVVSNGNGLVNGCHAETFPVTNGTGSQYHQDQAAIDTTSPPMATCTLAHHVTQIGDNIASETKEVRYESGMTAVVDQMPATVEVVMHKEMNGVSHNETEPVPAS